MNGVTGRMGTNQHLLRSIAEIMKQGGVKINAGLPAARLPDGQGQAGETIMPDPILVGRDQNKLEKLVPFAYYARFCEANEIRLFGITYFVNNHISRLF